MEQKGRCGHNGADEHVVKTRNRACDKNSSGRRQIWRGQGGGGPAQLLLCGGRGASGGGGAAVIKEGTRGAEIVVLIKSTRK